MPRRTNTDKPPPLMTWGKASPVLVVSAISDAMRLMFAWLIFFGPALAGLYCTIKGSGTAIGGLIGTKAVASACGVNAVAVGIVGAGGIETFGIIMAMATGLAGWLAILIILLMFNARIFKENALWFGGGLLISQIPFVNSLPALTFTVWKMYHTQIRIETASREKWKKERAEEERRERERQTAELMQAQFIRQSQIIQQESANQSEEIPEEVRKVA